MKTVMIFTCEIHVVGMNSASQREIEREMKINFTGVLHNVIGTE